MIDTSHLYYDGNSQGGIEGGLTTAVAPDFRRAVLGVTGIDYGNLLIQRSTDFAPFKTILDASYPDPSLYPVITDLLQQLWDRGDPDGYAPQMTSHPLPDTPSHTVLMQIAYGDFQVSMYAGAAEARTIGASAVRAGARSEPRPGIATCSTGSRRSRATRSAARRSRSGTAAPAGCSRRRSATSRRRAGSNNIDPHEDPRKTPPAQTQISDFLEPNGAVVNVCGGKPCHTSVFTP